MTMEEMEASLLEAPGPHRLQTVGNQACHCALPIRRLSDSLTHFAEPGMQEAKYYRRTGWPSILNVNASSRESQEVDMEAFQNAW